MGRMSIAEQIKHEQPSALGQGFKVYEINLKGGAERDVITYNHSALTKFVRQAEKYASKHGGDLPNTRFWNITISIFREDKDLFRQLHQCRELLLLLKKNEIYDRNNPMTPTNPGGPGIVIPPDHNPGGHGMGAVPEPASLIMMSIAIVGLAGYAWFSRKFRRSAAAC